MRSQRWGAVVGRASVTIVAAKRACDDVSLRPLRTLLTTDEEAPDHAEDALLRAVCGTASPRGVRSVHCFFFSVTANFLSFSSATEACKDRLILFMF